MRRALIAVAAAVPVLFVVSFLSWRKGWQDGASVGRAQVVVHQMRLHPRTTLDVPGGLYDFKRVAPSMSPSEILFRPNEVMWVPPGTTAGP